MEQSSKQDILLNIQDLTVKYNTSRLCVTLNGLICRCIAANLRPGR